MGFAFFFFLVIGWILYKEWYDSNTHVIEEGSLSPDAVPIKVSHKKVGLKGSRTFRTTVFFSDGFECISHGAVTKNMVFAYEIKYTDEVMMDAIAEAVTEHTERIKKKLKKNREEFPEIVSFQ